MKRMRLAASFTAILASAGLATSAAAKDPVVGGAPMSAGKPFLENIGQSKDHTTLVAAVKASGLATTLSGQGPFTVFAPTNKAFAKLPPGTVQNLMKPENKPQLDTVLTYHVVTGALTAKDLDEKIKAGGGKAELKTVQGETITIEKRGKAFEIDDAKGGSAHVASPAVTDSNGIFYVVDALLLP